MPLLHRNKSLSRPFTVRASVPINPRLSRAEQLKQWLNALPPRTCERHTTTELNLDRETSERETLRCDNGDNWHRRYMTPGVEVPDASECEKLYSFDAVYICPACRLAYALCPPEFHETSFDTFDTSTTERAARLVKAREFASQVNTHRCGFALFVGPPGVGKTRLACNIIRELENRDSLYLRQAELAFALRASYGHKDVILHRPSVQYDIDDEPADDRPKPLKIVQDVRFLALDEIGCNSLANDERLFLDELLKHRYEHRKPTIVISNLPLTGTADQPGLKEYLGDALTDRIREATGNGKFIVQFTGESYRRTTGEDYLSGLP